MRKLNTNLVSGLITVVIGVLILLESRRIYAFRVSALNGDHIMTLIVGALLVVLGLILAFIAKVPAFSVEYPTGRLAMRIILTMVVLFAYVGLIQVLGYTVATILAGIAVFRTFGDYSWPKCTVMAVIMGACLSLIFVFGLDVPFPQGIFRYL